MLFIRNTRGAIALTATIILTAVIAVIALNIAFTGISSRLNTFNLLESDKIFIQTEGCTEEALIQLNRNNSYSGGSYNINNTSCTVNVSGSDDNRTLSIIGHGNGFTHNFTLKVQLTPIFGILDWDE